jgi:hypothetical protein
MIKISHRVHQASYPFGFRAASSCRYQLQSATRYVNYCCHRPPGCVWAHAYAIWLWWGSYSRYDQPSPQSRRRSAQISSRLSGCTFETPGLAATSISCGRHTPFQSGTWPTRQPCAWWCRLGTCHCLRNHSVPSYDATVSAQSCLGNCGCHGIYAPSLCSS